MAQGQRCAPATTRRTRSWNSSLHRRPQRPPQSSFMLAVLPQPRAFFTATSPLPCGRPFPQAASAAAGTVDADGTPCGPASPPRLSFACVCSDGLQYLRSPRGDLLSVVVVRVTEDERRPERLVQTRPEGAREARVAVRYEHVGQPYVAEHRSDEVAGSSLSSGGLGGRDQPYSASQQVDVHLHKGVV